MAATPTAVARGPGRFTIRSIVVGLTRSQLRPHHATLPSDSDRLRWRPFNWTYAVWLFGVFAYFAPAATWSPVSRFDLTRAIVEQGTLQIDATADDTGDRARRDGHWYTDKAPFPSLAAVPGYAALHLLHAERGKRPEFISLSTPDTPAMQVTVNGPFARALYMCSLTTAGIAGVAIGLLCFGWLRRRVSDGAALFGSLGVTLATPIFPYATSFYGHVIAGALLLLAFTRITEDAPSRRSLRIAGAAMAVAVGCEYIVAVLVLIMGVFAIARARRRGAPFAAVVDLALGAALPALALAAYHAACFGSPLKTGYSFLPRAEFAAGHATGFMGIHAPSLQALGGLLVGPRRGLLYLAPITAAAIVGLGVRLARRRDATEALAAGLFLVLLVLNAGYYMWWGGAATGPRHLVPALGFLALGLAYAWDVPRLRPWLVGLAVFSFLDMLAFTAVGIEAPEHGDALFGYAWPRFLGRKIAHLAGASNLGIELGFSRATSLLPLLVWLVLGLRHLIGQLRALPDRVQAPAVVG
jgi:hypothetical protein